MQVIPFSEDSLAESLSNHYTSASVIAQKNQFFYLKNYLASSEINTQTIIIEENYVSKDYLEDYASYYSLCFQNYPKYCKRVHFFNSSFTEEAFLKRLISNIDSENFWEGYIGFVVVKPIPITVIGYTVLKIYSNSNNFNDRNYWGVRDYKIHLFGKELILESLAFQEQDSVLSACATTAIWSMLNKAALDFHTILKSPSQITIDADKVSPDGSRLFPNKGLNILQICQAILNSGLVSEIKNPDFAITISPGNDHYVVSNQYLKKILNAYSTIGIPIILVVKVPNGTSYGFHAVTVSGFNRSAPTLVSPSNQPNWLSDNIEKFYAHDDQWGPFVKVEFQNQSELITPWSTYSASGWPTYVTNIIVPVYPKIRISYEDIESLVLGLDAILTLFFDSKIAYDLSWDIRIDYSENFKSFLRNSNLEEEKIIKKLTATQPKYIWIASCYVGNLRILDFTFDATDVQNGMIGKDVISYLPEEIELELRAHLGLNKNINSKLIKSNLYLEYYQFIMDRL